MHTFYFLLSEYLCALMDLPCLELIRLFSMQHVKKVVLIDKNNAFQLKKLFSRRELE